MARCLAGWLLFGSFIAVSQSRDIAMLLKKDHLPDTVHLVGLDAFTLKQVEHQLHFLRTFEAPEVPLDSNEVGGSVIGRFLWHINLGDHLLYELDNRHIEARDHYIRAVDVALEKEDEYLICEGLKKLLALYSYVSLYDNSTIDYHLRIYEKYAYDEVEQMFLIYYRLLFGFYNSESDSWNRTRAQQLLEFAASSDQHLLNAMIYDLIGGHVYNSEGDHLQALALFQKGIKELRQVNVSPKSLISRRLYTGIVRCHVFEGQMDDAMGAVVNIKAPGKNVVEENYRRFYFFYQAAIDTALGDFQSGYTNMRKYTYFSEKLTSFENTNAIRILETEFQADRRKAEIAEQDRLIAQQDRFITIITILLSVLVILSVILVLAFQKIRTKNQKIETLMRELHHRVKNNLQVISSLLGLQSMKLSDESAKKAVAEGKGRIRAMSLIHQKLYSTEEVATLNIQEYVSSLIGELAQSFGFQDKAQIKIDVPSKSIDADAALSIGLILNELASNTFKHAFKDQPNPVLNVLLHNRGKNYTLTVADNGIGMKKDFDITTAESFGLKLVNLLIKQLKGKLSVSHENGLEVTLTFSM